MKKYHGLLTTPQVQKAFETNNLEALKEALKDTPMADKITQEHFDMMRTKYQKMNAIKQAIDNNDYDAFVKASTPSKEEFEMIKLHYQKMMKTISK